MLCCCLEISAIVDVGHEVYPNPSPWWVPRFLFDVTSPDYKYYEQRVAEEEQALQKTDSQSLQAGKTCDSLHLPP